MSANRANFPLQRNWPYLPELLARVLAARSLQDLWAARVLGDKIGNVVNIVVDDNPVALRIVLVLRYLLDAILAGHFNSSRRERKAGEAEVVRWARDRV